MSSGAGGARSPSSLRADQRKRSQERRHFSEHRGELEILRGLSLQLDVKRVSTIPKRPEDWTALPAVGKYIEDVESDPLSRTFSQDLLEDTASAISELGDAAGDTLQGFVNLIDGYSAEAKATVIREVQEVMQEGRLALAEMLRVQAELSRLTTREQAELPRAKQEVVLREEKVSQAARRLADAGNILAARRQQQAKLDADMSEARQGTLAIKQALGDEFRKLAAGDVEAGREKFLLGKMGKAMALLGVPERTSAEMRSALTNRPARRTERQEQLVGDLGAALRRRLAESVQVLAEEAFSSQSLRDGVHAASQEAAEATEALRSAEAQLHGARRMVQRTEQEAERGAAALLECAAACQSAMDVFGQPEKMAPEVLSRRAGRVLAKAKASLQATVAALNAAVAELNVFAPAPLAPRFAYDAPEEKAESALPRQSQERADPCTRRASSAPAALEGLHQDWVAYMASQMTSRYTWVSQKFSQEARQIDSARGDQSALWSLVGSRVPSESLSLTRAARRRQRLEEVLEESAEAQAAEAAEAEGGSSSSRSAAGTASASGQPDAARVCPEAPAPRPAEPEVRFVSTRKATIWKGHTTDGVPARRSFHEVQRRPSPAGEAAQGPLRVRTPRVRQARGATGAAEVAESRSLSPLPPPPRLTPREPAPSAPPSRGGWPLPAPGAELPSPRKLPTPRGAELCLPALPLAGRCEVQSARDSAARELVKAAPRCSEWRGAWGCRLEAVCEERFRLQRPLPPGAAPERPRVVVPPPPPTPAPRAARPFGRSMEVERASSLSPPAPAEPRPGAPASGASPHACPHGRLWRRRFVAVDDAPGLSPTRWRGPRTARPVAA